MYAQQLEETRDAKTKVVARTEECRLKTSTLCALLDELKTTITKQLVSIGNDPRLVDPLILSCLQQSADGKPFAKLDGGLGTHHLTVSRAQSSVPVPLVTGNAEAGSGVGGGGRASTVDHEHASAIIVQSPSNGGVGGGVGGVSTPPPHSGSTSPGGGGNDDGGESALLETNESNMVQRLGMVVQRYTDVIIAFALWKRQRGENVGDLLRERALHESKSSPGHKLQGTDMPSVGELGDSSDDDAAGGHHDGAAPKPLYRSDITRDYAQELQHLYTRRGVERARKVRDWNKAEERERVDV